MVLHREKVLGEGSSYFYEKTLESRKSLAAEIKRQFEKLPAELLYKAKNLDDGDEFDLDLVIGELMDKRAGHTPSGKVYRKKKKIQRDVAVAFLLDMSGSTADLINKNRTPMQYDESIKYDFMKFVMQPRRRIIDLEKESIVLLMPCHRDAGRQLRHLRILRPRPLQGAVPGHQGPERELSTRRSSAAWI